MKKTVFGIPFRTFMICWLCILLAFSVVFGLQKKDELTRESEAYTSRLSEKTDTLAQEVSDSFNRAVTTVASIASLRWYRLYMNQLNLFAEDLSSLAMQDLINQMINYVASLDYVQYILLAVPLDDAVISNAGWMSLREFNLIKQKEAIRVEAESGVNAEPTLTVTNENYFVHAVTPPTRFKKSMFFIIFDRQKLGKFVTRLANSQFPYLRIDYGEECVFSAGEMPENGLVCSEKAAASPIRVTAGTLSFRAWLMENGEIAKISLVMLGAVFLSALFAIVMIRLVWRPILNAIHPGEKTSYYSNPVHEVDNLVVQNTRLKSRFDEITSYFSELQGEVMYGILSGNILSCDYSVTEAIPWLSYGTPYLVLVMPLDCEDLPAEESEHDIRVHLLDCLCHVLWFRDDDAALLEREALLRTLDHAAVSEPRHAASHLRETFWEIYRQYREQFAQREAEDVPISYLYELTGAVINGHEDKAQAVLEKGESQYPAAIVEKRLCQIAKEYRVGTDALDGSWQGMAKCVSEICETVSGNRTRNSRKNANALCRYIEDHFSNPMMSVQLLCDEFNIGRTLLSQQIKEQTGLTFVDYLADVRMNHACKLLKSGQNAMDVGESVGYSTYSTFKRAFIRKYGISPRQWRDEALGVRTEAETESP